MLFRSIRITGEKEQQIGLQQELPASDTQPVCLEAKMIVTGDMTQIDLPASQTSGLVQALRILKGVKGISFVELSKKDIVRHKLVERIVDAYEKFDKEAKAERNGENKET